ncbi:MAG TPA: LysE family transporter [Actinomycetota bacterium]|nr:LysE family transporter [Actinomycetota bacterium]
MSAFVEGALAGYGIAIPIGAIAVLVIDLAMRRGFALAAAAAAGAATADLTYAAIAVLVGSALAEAVASFQDTLRVVSALVLLGIAVYLFRGALAKRSPGDERAVPVAGFGATYARFLGLTILNPATVTYFVALIVGLDRGEASAADKVLFVTGAFLASLSWQLWLAALGAFLHKRVPESVRWVFGAIGALVVAGFAVRLTVSG